MQRLTHDGTDTQRDWQDQFVTWLPTIQKQLRFAFRNLTDDSREEATQEALANCWVQYEKLHQQGRGESASPASLAKYAIRHVRCGRTVATRLNSNEPLSRYSQLRQSITVERIEAVVDFDDWLPVFADDRRDSVADEAALRIGTREWLAGLGSRLQRVATDLAIGFTTSEVAERYGLSSSRISQLRHEFHVSWLEFQGLLPGGAAT